MVWGQFFHVLAEAIPYSQVWQCLLQFAVVPLAPLPSRLLRAELYDQPSSIVPF